MAKHITYKGEASTFWVSNQRKIWCYFVSTTRKFKDEKYIILCETHMKQCALHERMNFSPLDLSYASIEFSGTKIRGVCVEQRIKPSKEISSLSINLKIIIIIISSFDCRRTSHFSTTITNLIELTCMDRTWSRGDDKLLFPCEYNITFFLV